MKLAFLFFAVLPFALGCSTVRTIAAMPGSPQGGGAGTPSKIRVGTARVDITPPPGPSTFGHGPDSIASQGYWTHLECRIFVIDTGKDRFAIVPCDLPAISYALYRDVVDRAKKAVPGDHLLLTATHTHAGPAHYFESAAYSGIFSTRRPGFDDEVLQMLSRRIANGIADAAGRLVDAELRWVTTSVWGMTRNRSIDAFEMNGQPLVGPRGKVGCLGQGGAPQLAVPDSQGLEDLERGPCKYLERDCRAIDPLLETLEIRETSRRPLGSITFFAMHPTVLPSRNRLFGADVFGVASRELEAHMRLEWAAEGARRGVTTDSDPLAAIVNTNEGDISPAWVSGDVEEARRIGRELGERTWKAHLTPVASAPYAATAVVEARIVEADMAKAVDVLKIDPARPAMLGEATGHGGRDHITTIDDIFARLPDWESPDGEQEPKASLLGSFQPTLVDRGAFPSRLPFAVWRVLDRWIAAVPAELTLTSGSRVRRDIQRVTGANPEQTLVAGLANGFMQYVSTCEEFQLQRYEGGSTLYGPLSQSFISAITAKLACELSSVPGASCGGAWPPGVHPPPFETLPIDPLIDRTGDRFPQQEPLVSALAQNVCRLPGEGAPRYCFRWLDAPPGDMPLAAKERGPGPWLRVRAKGSSNTLRWNPSDPRSFVDDWTDNFQTRARFECSGGRFSYTTLFGPTPLEWAGMTTAAPTFVLVAPNGTDDRLRIEFGPSTPLCRRDEVLFCTDEYDLAGKAPEMACKL